MAFDPYHEWLGIRPGDQPPNHYRLLGIAPFESNPAVISQAAAQRAEQVRAASSGQRADVAQRLLNEIAGARLCLLDSNFKQAYDADLARRSPPVLPHKTAGPTIKSRPAKRRLIPSFLGPALIGAALALAMVCGAAVLWLLIAGPQHSTSDDQAASKESDVPSASPSTEADEVAEHPATEVAPTESLEPPKSSPSKTAVSRPVSSSPMVTNDPAQESDSFATAPVQTHRGRKKADKKPPKSAPRCRIKPTGDPAIASTWLSADGQSITLVQQRDQFTATGVGTGSDHPGVIWRWSGTVDKDGHLSGRFVYTQGPSNSVDRGVTATLSTDGNTIEGTGLKVGLPDFPWTKEKTLPKLK